MALAMRRDASWFSRPDVRSTKAYHVDKGDATARCRSGWNGRPLVADTGIPLEEVPIGLRCQANGCRQAWPAESR